jgi:O-antigen/teichoic acid export membrane protein
MAAANLIYQFLVVSTVLSILSVPYEAIITAHENMFFYALLAIIESLLKLAIAIFINKSHFDHLVSYGFLMAGLSILLLIFRLIYCHWHYSECTLNLRKYFDKLLLTQMTGFSAWSFLGSASTMIANYGQGIIINIFFGTAINAAQSIANQISGQLGVLSVNMLKALNPLIDKSAGAGDRNLMMKVTMMGSKVSFFLVMAPCIPAIIEMPFLLETWLKNVPDFAVIFCRLLLIRNLIEHFFYPLISAISAVGNIKSYQTVSSLITLFPLPISYFLFQTGYPAYSIYVVYILYSILSSVIILIYSKKHCALSLLNFLTNVLLRGGFSFLLVFSISYLPHYYFDYGNLRFINTLVLSIISYLIVVLFLGFSGEERSKFKDILAPITQKFGRRKCLP